MATIKVIFRASSPSEPEGTLYYRIIHKRKVRQIHTGNRIARDEWDSEKESIRDDVNPARREYLRAVADKLKENRLRLERIVGRLDKTGKEYTSDEVVELYSASDTVVGFLSFGRKLVAENRQMGRISAAEHYSSALNSLVRFNGETDIAFEDFDTRFVSRYECYLKSTGLCPNTTSYYMRKLRAIYNHAVDRELTQQRTPFRHVYTGVAKTVKRAVSVGVIKTLRNMDLRLDPMSALARDMFLFSFYTRGMSMVDMAYLKKRNLQNGILTYRRKKTNQQLVIRWEDAMQEIVARNGIADSEYLLPLIKPNGKDERRQYLNASHTINDRLKKIGRQLGLTEPLTMYVARHAWASIARDNNIPISVISQGMGHDSENTTRIYLATLDTSVLDKANSAIINLLEK